MNPFVKLIKTFFINNIKNIFWKHIQTGVDLRKIFTYFIIKKPFNKYQCMQCLSIFILMSTNFTVTMLINFFKKIVILMAHKIKILQSCTTKIKKLLWRLRIWGFNAHLLTNRRTGFWWSTPPLRIFFFQFSRVF